MAILPDFMIRDQIAGENSSAMIEQTKVCSKCLVELPATFDHFYRHPSGRHGLTPRCKPCVNEDNALHTALRRAREPEQERARGRSRSLRHYQKDIEASRALQREANARRRSDPESRALINMRKRGGEARLTPADFDRLLAAQDGKCAICGTDEPNSKVGVHGWNIDHCHKTGNVRFILCSPCNRGLAAFRDDPIRMRRAADLLAAIEDRP